MGMASRGAKRPLLAAGFWVCLFGVGGGGGGCGKMRGAGCPREAEWKCGGWCGGGGGWIRLD